MFLTQVHNYIYDKLYPVGDEIQKGKEAKANFEKIELELTQFIDKIKENPMIYLGIEADIGGFLRSHKCWLEYRDSYVKSLFYRVEETDEYNSLLL
ncbi:MAG: hypothetical protein IPJ32_04590 [Sphingobacteriaceae bacterium]|nr:hypothetical protein [Sphingobacteriaceae bacterium]